MGRQGDGSSVFYVFEHRATQMNVLEEPLNMSSIWGGLECTLDVYSVGTVGPILESLGNVAPLL